MIGKIERVDQPAPGLLSFTLRGRPPGTLVVSTLPGALDAGIVERRLRGRPASESVTQLRHHIVGSNLVDLEQSKRFIRLGLTRAGVASSLVCAPKKPMGTWWLEGPDHTIVLRSAAARPVRFEEDALRIRSHEELRDAGQKTLASHRRARSAQLGRLIDRHRKRLDKKRAAILRDLERAQKADVLRERAGLILAYASRIPPGAASFEAQTWGDKPRNVTIELDPRKTPPELAEELFRKAKRLKRGLEVAPKRLELVETDLSRLADIEAQLELRDAESVADELRSLGVEIETQRERVRRREREGGRPPYRAFRSVDATPILVGRSAADNDRLTLRVARPHDLWLHARGVTGAHVVAQLAKGKPHSSETLVDAATLAAHFSDLRGETVVDVLYTPRRFVHKRKGSAIGSVTLDREKVIAVRIDEARLARLLQSES